MLMPLSSPSARDSYVTAFGIDIGGSGIKGAPVDLRSGNLAAARHRIPTPDSRTPSDIIDAVRGIVDFHGWQGPVGVTVPGVVIDGVVRSAANISPEWVDYAAKRELENALGAPVSVMNDADAAGMAEVRYGAGKDVEGVVLMLTFGTGIGSALIHDGVLVPNSELGHLEFKGMEAERYAASRLVKREGLDLETWANRANEFLVHVDRLFAPRLVIFGGGISKRFHDYGHLLEISVPIVPAVLRNNAGIVGAAIASESSTR
jgi:polyphosphate glucokinase